jgi:hypothetical protein
MTYTGLQTKGPARFNGYSCLPNLSPTGTEFVTELTCPTTPGDVLVDTTNFDRYPVVAVLKDSGSGNIADATCVTGNYYSARFPCSPGEKYFFVIDHEDGAKANLSFDLSVTCNAPTTEQDCDDGWDDDGDYLVDCSDTDCAGSSACPACVSATALACGDTLVAGDTSDFGSTDVVEGYSCTPSLDTVGREYTYVFTAPADGDVVFTASHAQNYPVVTVMEDTGSGCDPASCLAGNYYSTRFTAKANTTYYLTVDGTSDASFNYQISLVCDAPQAEQSCANSVDDDADFLIDCKDPDCSSTPECATGQCAPVATLGCTARLVSGSTAAPEATRLMSDYSCMSTLSLGRKELVYEFRRASGPAQQDVLVTLSNESNYATVAVMEDQGMQERCNPDNCVAGNYYGAQFRSVRGRSYYIAVEGSHSEVDFDLSVLCGSAIEPTETTCGDEIDNDNDYLIDCDDTDCAAACAQGDLCAAQGTIDCGTWLMAGSTNHAAATNAVSEYPCAPGLMGAGPERTYSFTATSTGWVNFTLSNETDYASVAVLENNGTCDPAECVSAQYYSSVAWVESGKTYHVVVDTMVDGGTVDFDLSVLCNPPINEESACGNSVDDDGDTLIDCADPDCAC